MSQDNLLDFDDVLIEPCFSMVRSRKDVDVSTDFLGHKISLPVINSDMDTIASPALCRALAEYGMIGSLHRFCSIEENVRAFKDSIVGNTKPIVSVGIGENELKRAKALFEAGADCILLDVAHAANIAIVEMYNQLVKNIPFAHYIVGDFGSSEELVEFYKRIDRAPDAVKVGIGIGSVCQTRLMTGVGNHALSCIMDCAKVLYYDNVKLILDGGVKHVGDIAKALVAGADLVMTGALFAGTDEAAGNFVTSQSGKFKEYRGSASYESYVVQSKVASWRAPEGRVDMIPYKGPVLNILNNINGGLRSACSYVNAFNLAELKTNGKFNFKEKIIR